MKSRNKILLLFITWLMLFSQIVYSQETAKNKELEITETFLNAITVLHTKSNTEKAAKLFLSIIKIDSTHAAAHFQLSRLIASPTKSLEHILTAYNYDTTNVWYQTSLTMKYVENKMYNKATEIATKTLKQNPTSIDSYTTLANIHVDAGRLDSAEKIILEYEKKFGTTDEALHYLGQIYKKQSPSPTLLAKLQKLADTHTHSELPYLILSEKQFALKLKIKAIESLKKAEKIAPNNLQVILMLSDHYLRTNNIENMIAYTKKAFANQNFNLDSKISLIEKLLFSRFFYTNYLIKVGEIVQLLKFYHPDNLRANNVVAQHYINCGMLDNVKNQYADMMDRKIADISTYYNMIALMSYQKQYDEIIKYCDSLTIAFPETAIDNAAHKSYAYLEMKQYENAINVLDINLKQQDKTKLSETYGIIGDIYNRWNKKEKSYNSYQKALKLNKNNIVVLNNYSYNLSVRNESLKKALSMIKKVIKIEPDNATYLDTFGWILYKLEEYDEAVAVLKKAVETDHSGSETIMMHYGDALNKIGKKAKAKLYWKKALDAGASMDKFKKRMTQE